MLQYILKVIVFPFYWLFRMPKVYGKEHRAAIGSGKAIVISNHRTKRDPVLLVLTLPRYVHFMAKAELFETKIGAWLFSSLLVFPVSRRSNDTKSMKLALELLNEGCVFGIFPEGKRCVTDDVDLFEKGAAFFAIKTNAPILPAYIPVDNYKLFVRPRVYYGKPILPKDYEVKGSKSAAINALNTLFEQRIDELRRQAGD